MKIGIHQEPSSAGIGGSEFVVAVLAHFLRQSHQVEIVHHRPWLTVQDFSDFFQIKLDGVMSRCVPRSSLEWVQQSDRWWLLGSDQAQRGACLSEGYDVFVTITHSLPPFCHAPRGVLYVMFPASDRQRMWPWNELNSAGIVGAMRGIKRYVYERAWNARMRSYGHHLAISQFSADWTARYWSVPCRVLPPPVNTDSSEGEKANQIALLGRFTPVKKQRELISCFGSAHESQFADWSMVCLGGLSNDSADQTYFADLIARAGDSPVRLVPNSPRATIQAELARSKVFWHAMGLGEDESRDPLHLEHFGIATVEAMASGCVPVVINKGGQREIVEQGVSGFLCENLKEIVDTTANLAKDEALRARMAQAAVFRAREFNMNRFYDRFIQLTRLS